MITQNKENAKVTIVIPIYKVAAYIADCLQSVYAQTYPELEVILVNDATPDDSMEQAASWIDKLRERFEVKVVNHEHNRGLSAARNTGIKVATGTWIYFLDSDDEITPNCIELLVKEVEKHPDVDFVIGGVKFVGTAWNFPLKSAPYVVGNDAILHDYTTHKWYMMAINHLYSKKYIQQHCLYFKEGLLHEDELYSFQVATTAQAMATVPNNTYIYKVRLTASITAHRRLKNFEDMLFVNLEKLAYIRKQYSQGCYIVPYTYCLDCMHTYTVSLVESNSIEQNDKVRLLSKLQCEYLHLISFRKEHLVFRYSLLNLLYKLPVRLILLFIKMRKKRFCSKSK